MVHTEHAAYEEYKVKVSWPMAVSWHFVVLFSQVVMMYRSKMHRHFLREGSSRRIHGHRYSLLFDGHS